MILSGLVVGGFGVNCYIVGCETTKKGMIIDPGDQANAIIKQIEKLGLDIDLVVNTHTHMDHVLALAEVVEATNARYAVHEAELPSLQKSKGAGGHVLGGKSRDVPVPDLLLHGEEILSVGELQFSVLHTPGHSPGGICLAGHGVVFTGDTLFAQSIGRTDFPGGSFAQIIDSIKTKLLILPDDTAVLPGHGPESTIGTERRRNPFLTGRYQPPPEDL